METQLDSWLGENSGNRTPRPGSQRQTQYNPGSPTPRPDNRTPRPGGQRQTQNNHGNRDGYKAPQKQGRSRGSNTAAGADHHSEAYYLPRDAALPNFSYTPQQNHRADPGEVVWTWVPFEEDASRGKDRPVLVLAETDRGVIASQMTSRDRTADFLPEDRYGRAWLDIGTGSWDREGRNSEVRLDRLLMIPRGSMRREGGRLDKATFLEVVARIREMHG
ncbi:MAG: type II toxin-antitoxin system PemK/MazF family toxin [Actinomycetaceae bacterium]|nr:type II toxin-antitoxin system PemK/MazF family toxin [Actinomycetaceae bacterium]